MSTHLVEFTDRELRALSFAASMGLRIFGPELEQHREGEPVVALESAAMKLETAMVMEGVNP